MTKAPRVIPVGPILIMIAATFWAFDGIMRRSLFSLPPITIVFYEHLIGAVLLMVFGWRELTRLKLTRRVLALGLAVSLLSSLLGTLWFTIALSKVNFISFSVVFLLQKLQPLFAISSAAFFLREKITRRYVLWAGVALAAAYFVTFPGGRVDLQTGAGTVTAALFAVGAAAAWGTGTTISKFLLNELSDLQATLLRFCMTMVLSFMGVFVLGQSASLTLVTGPQLTRLVMIALSTGMVALWIYYQGLKYTQVKIATILELTFPLLAVIIDGVLYKSYLQPVQWLAVAVLLFAMSRVAWLQVKDPSAQ